MGLMNKMRDNTHWILWILVVAFGLIWVLNDSGAVDTLGRSGSNTLGTINGVDISRQEYGNIIANMEAQYSQMGQPLTPELRDQIAEQAWKQLTERAIINQELDRLGITVTEQEVRDKIFGANPDDFIKQQFSDQNGNVNQAALRQFWNDAQNKDQIISIQDFIRNKIKREKLQAAITASVNVSDTEVVNEFIKQNGKFSADYVAYPYSNIKADQISISESDLNAYYKAHEAEYKRKKRFKFEYVSANIVPSAADTAKVVNKLKTLRGGFAQAKDVAKFMQDSGSLEAYSEAPIAANTVPPALADSLRGASVGRVVGPMVIDGNASLIRFLGTSKRATPLVNARHILVKTEAEAKTVLSSLSGGQDFATLAREKSQDTGSAQNGGSLGWQDSSQFVPEFKDALLRASVGQRVGPVKTQFGYHIIELQGKDDNDLKYTKLVLPIESELGSATKVKEKLDDIAEFGAGNLGAEVKKHKGFVLKQNEVEDGATTIPLLGNSRTLMGFLKSAKVGDVSQVIEVRGQMILAKLVEVKAEGLAPFEEVKESIRALVSTEKRKAVAKSKLEGMLGGKSIDQLAQALNIPKRNVTDQNFGNAMVSGLGEEPAFGGAAIRLNAGQRSGVVLGKAAAFVLKVTAKNANPPDPTNREAMRQQLLNARKQAAFQSWLDNAIKKADLTDNRASLGL